MDFNLGLKCLLVQVIWSCIHESRSVSNNPVFALVFLTQDVLAAVFFLSRFRFCPGLLAQLQSSTPPTLEWFRSLPSTVRSGSWGVYVLLYEKSGCKPMIYIGSGTHLTHGIRFRITQHISGQRSPVEIAKAVASRYRLTNTRLLAYCPIPSGGSLLKHRAVIVALETALTLLFSALRNRSKHYGLPDLCRWKGQSFEYDGLCGHNPLIERVHGADEVASEARKRRKEKRRVYMKTYDAELNKVERSNPSPEQKKKNQIKDRKRAERRRIKGVESRLLKLFRCEECDFTGRDASDLKHHKSTPRHLKTLEHPKDKDGAYRCEHCPGAPPFYYLSHFKAHQATKKHLRNAL